MEIEKNDGDAKTAFRKPTNEAANRKYRRRSPINGSSSSSSSSSDGSPNRERSSSPIPSRKDPTRISNDRRRKDDARDLDRESGRSNYGRSGESYRYSDRQSSRSSHGYYRHDDCNRRDKHAEDYDDKEYLKSSSRAGHDNRGKTHSRQDRENRSRDYARDGDKYSRDRSDVSGHRSRDKEKGDSSVEYQNYRKDKDSSDRPRSGRRHINSDTEEAKSLEKDRPRENKDGRDEKINRHKSSEEPKGENSPAYEETRGHRNDATSRRDSSGHRLKEASRGDSKELDSRNYNREDRKKYEGRDRYKERFHREPAEEYKDRKTSLGYDGESLAKKPKLAGKDGGPSHEKDVPEPIASVDEKGLSKQVQEGNVTSERAYVTDSDIDAAKVAAMKAAELVNRNLIGTGYMSTDQKKKLLWGSKKSAATEESTNRWDTSIFGDRERQEKFNKLMGVKGDLKVEQKPDNHNVEKQREQLQLDLEKQYTAGLRRRDGRTVGLGL